MTIKNTHLARVVDKSSRVSLHCSINDYMIIDTEHVAADALIGVELLPLVGKRGPNQLACVLDDHFAGLDFPRAE